MKTKKAEPKKADGSFSNPLPWVPPYPASKLKLQDPKDEDLDGNAQTEETVFVRANVHQDIIINGKKYATGNQTLPCFVAHQFNHAVSAPKE